MLKATKEFLIVLATVATLYVIAILAAGVSQLAEAAAVYDPRLGPIVLWTLSIAFLLLLLWPVVLYLRFPKPLIPPADGDTVAQAAYLAELRSRLRRNPLLRDLPLESDEHLQPAIAHLSRKADQVVEEAATRVFLGTALLQNGRLDGLVVLATQFNLVWRIADIYYQRPSPRQMAYLYANVGTTAFLAAELDDVDFAEMLQPVVVSTLASVPAAAALSSVLINSLSSGAANAFLTLRVGAVARLYCEATVTPVRGAVRRSATASAAKHLGRIIQRNMAAILGAVTATAKKATESSLTKIADSARSVRESLKELFKKEGREPKDDQPAEEPGATST